MCGIIGIVNGHHVADDIVSGLGRLAYRGYDSAGLATVDRGRIARIREAGPVDRLASTLGDAPVLGHAGIGHTRWATHGPPNAVNAHPHATEAVAVVHNGVIENHRALRAELTRRGRRLASDTDSEVIPHLVSEGLDAGLSPRAATRAALARCEGSFAVGLVFADAGGMMMAARRGSPLVVGTADGGAFLSSDGLALSPWVREVVDLEDGDVAELTGGGVVVYDDGGRPVSRSPRRLPDAEEALGLSGWDSYTRKEIAEQPAVLARLLSAPDARARAVAEGPMADLRRLSVVACGTSRYAGSVARHWFEGVAGVPTTVHIASEHRYGAGLWSEGEGALFISQSGETADTLAALRWTARAGVRTLSVVNVAASTMAAESDAVLLTEAGPEIGVASTKAFTAQLAVLGQLAIEVGRARGALDEAGADAAHAGLRAAATACAAPLKEEQRAREWASRLVAAERVLFLGRGALYPLALEGALKLKEISYLHAEGYAAGELKHGPLAMVEPGVPVVVLAPSGPLFAKTLCSLEEVRARGGEPLVLTDAAGAEALSHLDEDTVWTLPTVAPEWTALPYAIPLQLLAYHAARLRGTDVDRPRNLAKSVTVE